MMYRRLMVHNPPVMGSLIALTVLTVILAACGPNNSTSGGQPNRTPPAQAQKCGSVDTRPDGKLTDETIAKQAENCFWQAYQHCQVATLTFTKRGVDAGTIHTFTFANNNGQCLISDAIQTYIAPNGPRPGNTFSCTGLTQQADGLHFASCGAFGDIIVPNSSGE
jgi:hypothetical protein